MYEIADIQLGNPLSEYLFRNSTSNQIKNIIPCKSSSLVCVIIIQKPMWILQHIWIYKSLQFCWNWIWNQVLPSLSFTSDKRQDACHLVMQMKENAKTAVERVYKKQSFLHPLMAQNVLQQQWIMLWSCDNLKYGNYHKLWHKWYRNKFHPLHRPTEIIDSDWQKR